ncbi:MAG: hypothetical protein HZA48_04765 [Planctomycetes bacterium]|nr:hypothetical protein [Planctomycetota bacterium]
MIFLTLQGTPYEIGFHHGRELKYLIHNVIRQRGWYFYGTECPSRETIKSAGDKLKSAFPEMMEEMRGIADGADMPLDDILLLNLRPLKEGCSNLALLCEEGPMLGHVDDNIECMADIAFRVRYASGLETKCIAIAGSIGYELQLCESDCT